MGSSAGTRGEVHSLPHCLTPIFIPRDSAALARYQRNHGDDSCSRHALLSFPGFFVILEAFAFGCTTTAAPCKHQHPTSCCTSVPGLSTVPGAIQCHLPMAFAPTQDKTHRKAAGESRLGTRGHFQTAPGAPSSLLLTNNIHLTGHSARNCLHPSNSQSPGSAPACQEPGMEQRCASGAGTIPTALPGSIH